MICMSMGYPALKDEVAILKGKSRTTTSDVNAVITQKELLELKEEVNKVHVNDKVFLYVAQLSAATRENAYVELGLSPRGSIACIRMAKAWAYFMGRDYVLPEDIVAIFKDIGKHRIVLNTKARVARISEGAVLDEVLSKVKQPTSFMRKKEDYRA